MTGRLRTGGWLFWLNFGLSLAIHIRIALYLLPGDPEKLGAAPMPTTAISVNIETTDVLDAVEQSVIAEAAASSTPGGEPAPQEEVKLEQPVPTVETVEVKPQAAPEPEAKPEPDPRPEPPVSTVEERPEPAEILEQSEKERVAEEALRRAMEAELERRRSEMRSRENARQRAMEATRQERREREEEAR